MTRKAILIFFLCILPACRQNKHRPPNHSMPQKFEYQCSASDQEPLCHWWQQFNDPVLNELIEKALKNNYDLRIAVERIEEARAFYQIKRADLFPEIDVIGEVRRTQFSKEVEQFFTLQGKKLSFFQFGFDAFWELDLWGRIWHAKQARYYKFLAQIDAMRDVYIILLADVARTYVALCTIAKQLELLCDRQKIDAMLLKLEKNLFCAGLSSKVAVVVQEQALATTENQIKERQTAFGQTKNQLAVLLGSNPEDLSLPQINDDIPFYRASVAVGIPSQLLRRRPDIREAEMLLASKNQLVSQAVAEWFPRFILLGNVLSESTQGSDWFSGDSISWSFAPSIRWPLINFGRISARIDVQTSLEKQAALAYSNTIIKALKEVEDFLIAYFNAQQQREILEQKQKSAYIQEELIYTQFNAGIADQLNALRTAKNRIDVMIEKTFIQQFESSALISLYKALGGGW